MLCLKIAGSVANSVDPDKTPHFAVSHLGLHRLLRPPNTCGKYSIDSFSYFFTKCFTQSCKTSPNVIFI